MLRRDVQLLFAQVLPLKYSSVAAVGEEMSTHKRTDKQTDDRLVVAF